MKIKFEFKNAKEVNGCIFIPIKIDIDTDLEWYEDVVKPLTNYRSDDNFKYCFIKQNDLAKPCGFELKIYQEEFKEIGELYFNQKKTEFLIICSVANKKLEERLVAKKLLKEALEKIKKMK